MGAIIYTCPHCGEIIDNDSTSKCKKCGKFLVKAIENKLATAINPELGMICSICEKGFPVISPRDFPICPSCLKALRLLINSVKTQEALNDKKEMPL